jgi:hypothetical protein
MQPQVIVYQLLAQSWWFSLGTLASSTTKTGRHDIAEILLKVGKISTCLHFQNGRHNTTKIQHCSISKVAFN